MGQTSRSVPFACMGSPIYKAKLQSTTSIGAAAPHWGGGSSVRFLEPGQIETNVGGFYLPQNSSRFHLPPYGINVAS